MAYTDYSSDQINQFLNSKGAAGSDPWAMLAYARQYNADPMKVAAARGIDPAEAQRWLTGAQQQMAGPIADTRGLADRNPYMAYNVAKSRGMSSDQAATMYGKDGIRVNAVSPGLILTAEREQASPAAYRSLMLQNTLTLPEKSRWRSRLCVPIA